jgi:hypothetical protein
MMESEEKTERLGAKLESAIDAMLPSITEQVIGKLRERALSSFEHQVQTAIAQQVSEYLKTTIAPSVAEELRACEPEIRAAVVAGVRGGALALGAAIEKKITDKVSGYDGDKVIGEILRSLSPRAY